MTEDRVERRVGGERVELAGKLGLHPEIIRVEEPEEGPVCLLDAPIERSAESGVRLGEAVNRSAEASRDSGAAVRRTVVDDEDLAGRRRLREGAADGRSEIALAVRDGDDSAD